MTPLFKKLNLGKHREIHVIEAPASFESELALLDGVAIRRDMKDQAVSFAIFFVTTRKSVSTAAARLRDAGGDPIIWFAYPKASSKNYRCEFNRDNGWDALGRAGFEAVRQVSIDSDWSALRFRRVDQIKRLTRDPARALTHQGRSRAANPNQS